MRSIGEKIIVVATLTLLLCMLLYSLLSWGLLRLSGEHEASNNAQVHLSLFRRAYQIHTTNLIDVLDKVTHSPNVTSTILYPSTQEHLENQLATVAIRYHLLWLAIVSNNYHIRLQIGRNTDNLNASVVPEIVPLINKAFQGSAVTILQKNIVLGTDQLIPENQWSLSIALPIRDSAGTPRSVLLAVQPIDDYFAQGLAQQVGTNVLLCLSREIQGTSSSLFNASRSENETKVCTQSVTHLANGTEQYLMVAGFAKTKEQMAYSPDLEIVTVESIATSNITHLQHILIITGVGLLVFALGIIIYLLLINTLLITPLRRLQTYIHTQLTSNVGTQITLPHSDEIDMLSLSFNLLSDSLESESQALTEQMTNILLISDTLISTLNLEHLLGEIVSRLGHIMQVTHVSLLLHHGREDFSPWAVAQWEKTAVDPSSAPPHGTHDSLQEQETITVHVDPDGDITMAVTTKMAAISSQPTNQANSKHGADATPKKSASSGSHRSRIPSQARRDLDMTLARIVTQRKKIACGEDIAMIYEERKDNWARMALDAGYCSAIAVPLLLRDQAIGAFILYTDKPHPISNRDTFLLSTVSMQASMAIQNALLFAAVKEKNAALERASRLKAQFLANVTHELRTPLHSIISYGDFILEGFGDGQLTAEQEQQIQIIVGSAEDLSRLVDDMLDLSKIEADRIEIKLEPLDLRSCLMEVVNQLKPMAKNKELYLSLEMEEGLPMVMADSHRIRQVALNLASNALKFTEKGSVSIHCTLVRDGKMLLVSVHDTGIGISPAALSYIFEAFQQADGSTTRRFGGTGLGLTIARKLVELQGSEIAVESVPGQGSTFSFALPVVSSTNEI